MNRIYTRKLDQAPISEPPHLRPRTFSASTLWETLPLPKRNGMLDQHLEQHDTIYGWLKTKWNLETELPAKYVHAVMQTNWGCIYLLILAFWSPSETLLHLLSTLSFQHISGSQNSGYYRAFWILPYSKIGRLSWTSFCWQSFYWTKYPQSWPVRKGLKKQMPWYKSWSLMSST